MRIFSARPNALTLTLCVSLLASAGCGGGRPSPRTGPPREPTGQGADGSQGSPTKLPRAFAIHDAVNNTWIGPRRAPVTIEVFSDFQCPFCASSHHVLTTLARRYPRELRIHHRDLPLDSACNPRLRRPFHERACEAALYARCAAAQGKFWPYATLLSNNFRALDVTTLRAHAETLKLDTNRFASCVNRPAARKAIEADIAEAGTRGITGTPTFYLNGKQLRGHKGLSQWIQLIEAALATAKSKH